MYCVYYSYYKRIEDLLNRGKYTNNVEKIIPVYITHCIKLQILRQPLWLKLEFRQE